MGRNDKPLWAHSQEQGAPWPLYPGWTFRVGSESTVTVSLGSFYSSLLRRSVLIMLKSMHMCVSFICTCSCACLYFILALAISSGCGRQHMLPTPLSLMHSSMTSPVGTSAGSHVTHLHYLCHPHFHGCIFTQFKHPRRTCCAACAGFVCVKIAFCVSCVLPGAGTVRLLCTTPLCWRSLPVPPAVLGWWH